MYTTSEHTFAVCAYKESPYLADCLDSLLAQASPQRIVVCTSTPNDLIFDLCRERGLALYVNPGPGGIAGDWNFAVAVATGAGADALGLTLEDLRPENDAPAHTPTPLVTIAHQDDTYEPGYLETALACLNRADEALLFCSNYGELRDSACVDTNRLLRVKRALMKPLANPANWNRPFAKRRALAFGCAICCPSVTLVAERLPFAPLFAKDFGSNLDWQAWTALAQEPGAFAYSDAILMHHRIHAGSETSALIANNQRSAEDFAMFQKFWPKPVARALSRLYASSQKSNDV